MATEDLWDQSGYNMELFFPARDAHLTAGATVRDWNLLLRSEALYKQFYVYDNQHMLVSPFLQLPWVAMDFLRGPRLLSAPPNKFWDN